LREYYKKSVTRGALTGDFPVSAAQCYLTIKHVYGLIFNMTTLMKTKREFSMPVYELACMALATAQEEVTCTRRLMEDVGSTPILEKRLETALAERESAARKVKGMVARMLEE
jgi:hypothetical protein